jgi:hypothetical protein
MTPEQDKLALDAIFDGTAIQLVFCEDAPAVVTFPAADVDTGTDTIDAANDFVAGTRGSLSTDGALPGGLESGRIYWVVSPSSADFQLADEFGGDPIDITSQGTGTHTFSELSQRDIIFDGVPYPVRSVADVVRMEIGDYEGATNRPTTTGPSAIIGDDPLTGILDTAQTVMAVTVDNGSGSEDIEFDFAAAITGGSATPGNTTGTLLDVYPLAAPGIIPAGVSLVSTFTTIARFSSTL